MINSLSNTDLAREIADNDLSDEGAVTIARNWHGGSDTNITGLSHGREWTRDGCLDEIDQNITRTRETLGYSDEANTAITELNALRKWVTEQTIVSVWSSYGHTFMTEDGYEKCLSCGATYELVFTPSEWNDGRYRGASGAEPTECTGESLIHGMINESGHDLDCEDGCSLCQHDCNCLFCA
jgi:hypothetical protein